MSDPSPPTTARRRGLARLPGWGRDVIAAIVVAQATIGPLRRLLDEPTVWAYALALAPAALMFVRRRWPWAALAGCVAAYFATTFLLGVSPFAAIPSGIALFTIAIRYPRRTVVLTTLALVVAMVPVAFWQESAAKYATVTSAPVPFWQDSAEQHPFSVLILTTLALCAALGDATRTRRAWIDQIVQRAELAEQTRDAEASRRVAEDRLRIARDLHDTVAHQISVISLNAGVADRTLTTDPDAARAALATARAASRDVLGEIGDLLATLRAPDEAAPRGPVPGIAQLDGLYASFERSGLAVTVRHEGGRGDGIPTAVDETVYRLVQECLTNAGKHGADDRAHVWLEHRDDAVHLVVTNPAAAEGAADRPPGHGILGMRERVAALGGTIDISQHAGVFRVDVVLPPPRPDAADGAAR
ncbi:sensor histidine kinase [Microbacterium sp.]|uniref:sensor histidine kinase n=1 Tax=Microbacterium sp. TaxID=51671 RepID=UPI003A868F45